MIYVVCLVDGHGELTPLFACWSEEMAQKVADRMGGSGTVIEMPLVDEAR